MGMKANGGFFKETSGALKFKLSIQKFASKLFDPDGHLSYKNIESNKKEIVKLSLNEFEKSLEENGYKTRIRLSNRAESNATIIETLNPNKNLNITQIQLSQNSNNRHKMSYVKFSTKDIGVIKVADGKKSDYVGNKNEKARIIFTK